MEDCILAQEDRLPLDNGKSLRLLSAMEILQARREAERLAQEEREKALCANACLLAKALERDGGSVFADGEDVLACLTVGEIAGLSSQWWAFNQKVNPSPRLSEAELENLKKN